MRMDEKIVDRADGAAAKSAGKKRMGEIWRKYGYYIFFFLSFFMYELILRISTVKSWSFFGLLFSVLFNSILAFLVCYATTFASKKVRIAINNILLVGVGALYVSQIIYYNVFRTYYSPESMAHAGQIVGFWRTIVGTAWGQIVYILIIAAPVPLYNTVIRKTTIASVERKIKKLPRMDAYRLQRRRRIGMCVVMSAYILIVMSFIPFARDSTTAYSKFFGQESYVESINRTGLLSTMHVDLLKQIVEEDASTSLISGDKPYQSIEEAQNWNANPSPASSSPGGISGVPDISAQEPDGVGTTDVAEPSPSTPVEYGYNVMPIDFAALMEGEKNDSVISLHEYFAYEKPSQKNEYTGMFEGYNLIMFTAEGFSQYAVDPVLTPTLYKMVNEGFHFTNFYTPIWGTSTSDGEYVACTGLIPKPGVWSFKASAENYLPFTMGNQLKKLGYKTNAYHNHTYTFYGRDISHPNMGYDYKGIGNGLELESKKIWPNSDYEMMVATMDEYIGSQPFHAYYMTVSGHLEYNFLGNTMASRNKAAVADLPYSDPCKAYIACNIELDKALEYMMQRLNEAGIAEKTLIVLSADHYPYGLKQDGVDFDGISEFLGHPVEETFELYRNNLIIYAQGMEPVTVDKPACSLDIIPTLSNLMGLEFDSRFLMGNDILSNSPALVIFIDRSFITDKGYYRRKESFVPNPGVEVSENYERFLITEVDHKFTASQRILDTDYYAKVFG